MKPDAKGGRRGILRNTAIVGAMTTFSRVLGLVREMFQSRLIGAGVEQSAFTLAFAIPNMMRKLFGEGALTAAFVPVFKGEVEAERMESARRLARAVMTMCLLMLAAVSALAVVGLSAALHWGVGFSERTSLTLRLTRILVPYMVFICGAAFGMGVLNALGRFAAAALMPCLLNVVWIGALGALCFFPDMALSSRIVWVSGAILFAGFLQMAFMFWCMKRRGVSPRPSRAGWGDPNTRLVWRNMLVAAVGAGAVQINYMLDQVLAQLAAPWAAGVIGYAERLMDLPLGIVGVAFGTVLLPTFAGCFAKEDVAGARAAFLSSADNLLFVMVPAAVGLGILAPDLTRVIYEGKAFDATATLRVGRAVACYAVGLGFFGLQKTLVPWFQAQKDMKTPLAVSVKMVFLNATLNVLAVFLLPVEWRHVGLAASTVFCAGVACVWLAVLARRKNGALGLVALVRPVGRTLAASAAMGAALWAARAGLVSCGWTGVWANVVQLGMLVVFGAMVYFGTHFLFARRTFAARLRALRRRR